MHILFIAAIGLIASFPLGIPAGRVIRDAKGREDTSDQNPDRDRGAGFVHFGASTNV